METNIRILQQQVKNLRDALMDQVDCTLATYEHLLMCKRHSKNEVKRQWRIAIKAVAATGLTKEYIAEWYKGNRINDHWECKY